MGALDLPEERRVIGGLAYAVQPLPARLSLQVMTRVLRMAGPGFGDVASLAQAAQAVGELLAGFAANLDEDVILFVCDALAGVSRVETGSHVIPLGPSKDGAAAWSEHFRGKPVELFEWLKFAAEVSYGPLADALKARLPKAAASATSPAAPGASAAGA